MIKEFLERTWVLLKSFFRFDNNYFIILQYNLQNYYEYLIKGYDNSDLGDLDYYILKKLNIMVKDFYKNSLGIPYDIMKSCDYDVEKATIKWRRILEEFIYNSNLLLNCELGFEAEEIYKEKIDNFLKNYFFYLWY